MSYFIHSSCRLALFKSILSYTVGITVFFRTRPHSSSPLFLAIWDPLSPFTFPYALTALFLLESSSFSLHKSNKSNVNAGSSAFYFAFSHLVNFRGIMPTGDGSSPLAKARRSGIYSSRPRRLGQFHRQAMGAPVWFASGGETFVVIHLGRICLDTYSNTSA